MSLHQNNNKLHMKNVHNTISGRQATMQKYYMFYSPETKGENFIFGGMRKKGKIPLQSH